MSKKDERTPLYEQVYRYIVDQLNSGNWESGRKLPSETQLCKQFSVSRITVRGAMNRLVEEGKIYRIQGRGSFVNKRGEQSEPLVYSGIHTIAETKLQLIAVLIPRIVGLLITRILRGLDKQLAGTPYRLLLLITEDSQEKEDEKLREALSAGAKGIVVYPSEGRSYNETMLRLSLDHYPIVVIDRYLQGVPTNCVCSDHFQGAYDATCHLLDLDHQHIGFVTHTQDGTTSIEERFAGFRQALADRGLPMQSELICDQEDVQAFLQANPQTTALFAINEETGMGVIRAARKAGRNVPADLSVVFFDDYAYSDEAKIPPTCVAQDGEQIGRAAAKLLLSLMENHTTDRQMVRIPTQLIIRSTTTNKPNSLAIKEKEITP